MADHQLLVQSLYQCKILARSAKARPLTIGIRRIRLKRTGQADRCTTVPVQLLAYLRHHRFDVVYKLGKLDGTVSVCIAFADCIEQRPGENPVPPIASESRLALGRSC